jgi:hypothetical protein
VLDQYVGLYCVHPKIMCYSTHIGHKNLFGMQRTGLSEKKNSRSQAKTLAQHRNLCLGFTHFPICSHCLQITATHLTRSTDCKPPQLLMFLALRVNNHTVSLLSRAIPIARAAWALFGHGTFIC